MVSLQQLPLWFTQVRPLKSGGFLVEVPTSYFVKVPGSRSTKFDQILQINIHISIYISSVWIGYAGTPEQI
jgi:hypothetical protein